MEPQGNLLISILSFFSDLGMIVGGSLGFMVQARKMYAEKTFEGFSTYVSFILILSNLIRLFWWYCERFSLVILYAAIMQIVAQMMLIYVWVMVSQMPSQ